MRTLIDALHDMAQRHDRFTYDLRGQCRVLTGTVAAYRPDHPDMARTDPARAIAHALDHDGILGAWRDPGTGMVQYQSCRLFTGQDQALRFAEEQDQQAVFNLNRMIEVPVSHDPRHVNTQARSVPPTEHVLPFRASINPLGPVQAR